MSDLKAKNLARLERVCLAGALAALFVGAAWKSGAGGVIMGRYQATPPTLADGAPMDFLMGPRAELIVGTSAVSSLRVQGTTEDGVAPLTSEDAPVQIAGRDQSTGLVQTIATNAAGNVAMVTSESGAGAVAATTPRMTLASDDPAVTALQIIDDWDEANRAAVNVIAGQVGVQGGSGAATALTQRVAQATDDLVPLATTTDGGAASTRMVTVGGFDGANAQQLLTAASGALRVDPTGTTAQPVTDAAGSLTVDAPVAAGVHVRGTTGAAAYDVAAMQLEDEPAVTGSGGVFVLGVRDDAGTAVSAGATGDWIGLATTSRGVLKVVGQPEAYIDALGAVYLVQTAFTTVTTAGAAEIQPVAAQGAGNSIVLIDWIVSTTNAVTVQFESDDSDAGITVQVPLAANGGWTSDHSAAWGETTDNQALKLQVSAASTVSVQVRYFVR